MSKAINGLCSLKRSCGHLQTAAPGLQAVCQYGSSGAFRVFFTGQRRLHASAAQPPLPGTAGARPRTHRRPPPARSGVVSPGTTQLSGSPRGSQRGLRGAALSQQTGPGGKGPPEGGTPGPSQARSDQAAAAPGGAGSGHLAPGSARRGLAEAGRGLAFLVLAAGEDGECWGAGTGDPPPSAAALGPAGPRAWSGVRGGLALCCGRARRRDGAAGPPLWGRGLRAWRWRAPLLLLPRSGARGFSSRAERPRWEKPPPGSAPCLRRAGPGRRSPHG